MIGPLEKGLDKRPATSTICRQEQEMSSAAKPLATSHAPAWLTVKPILQVCILHQVWLTQLTTEVHGV
jgi:hypothetical protein